MREWDSKLQEACAILGSPFYEESDEPEYMFELRR
jgi:hypothetical protein